MVIRPHCVPGEVKTLIDLLAKTTESIHLQIELCIDTIEWCKAAPRDAPPPHVTRKVASAVCAALT